MICDHPLRYRDGVALGSNGDWVGYCKMCGEEVREVISDITDEACEIMDLMEIIFRRDITPSRERLIIKDRKDQP